MCQKYFTHSKLYEASDNAPSTQCLTPFFSDIVVAWTDELHETFFKAEQSVIATQRAFPAYFMLCQNDAVLDKIFNP